MMVDSYTRVANLIPKASFPQLGVALSRLETVLTEDETVRFKGVMALVGKHTDYFSAPASAKFHLNEEGGLYKHSLGVTYRLWSLDAAYELFPQYSYLDVFLSGLLHDLGKAGQVSLVERPTEPATKVGTKSYDVVQYLYYVKRNFTTKTGYEYRRNPDRVVMSIPLGSLHFIGTMLGDFWKPSPTVWAAIAYHDGQYVDSGKEVAHSETKLGLALHQADMLQSRAEVEWANGSGWKG